jgi:DNA repair protein RecO (recombination protein O)
MISGRSLLCLLHEQLEEPQVLKETKRLMRLLIEQHLDGRPLRTRDLYRFL